MIVCHEYMKYHLDDKAVEGTPDEVRAFISNKTAKAQAEASTGKEDFVCGRRGCERSFKNAHGLSIHKSKGH